MGGQPCSSASIRIHLSKYILQSTIYTMGLCVLRATLGRPKSCNLSVHKLERWHFLNLEITFSKYNLASGLDDFARTVQSGLGVLVELVEKSERQQNSRKVRPKRIYTILVPNSSATIVLDKTCRYRSRSSLTKHADIGHLLA